MDVVFKGAWQGQVRTSDCTATERLNGSVELAVPRHRSLRSSATHLLSQELWGAEPLFCYGKLREVQNFVDLLLRTLSICSYERECLI